MRINFKRESSLEFADLLENERFSDFKIFVQEGPGTKFLSAHKAILAAGSGYFDELLTADPKTEAVNLNERYDIVSAG